MKLRNGFTLIELLVSLAILAMLASLTVPVMQTVQQRRQEQQLRLALREIRHAIDEYKAAAETGRIAKSATTSPYPANLELLVNGVTDLTTPKAEKIYFLRRLPRDPLNTNAELSDEQSWGKRSYASEPDTPREGEDVYDVYSTSEKTGLNGIAYRKW